MFPAVRSAARLMPIVRQVCIAFRSGDVRVPKQRAHNEHRSALMAGTEAKESSDERDRWEKIAAEQDAAREAQHAKKIAKMGAAVGAPPQKQREPTTVSDWLVDSRGGTRTRDPGIMSAVL